MTVRTKNTEVTFTRPFRLSYLDGEQPAGTYRLVVDEEEVIGLSFLAYRRVATMLHTPAISVRGGPRQVFAVDPQELATALDADTLAYLISLKSH
jgi:hypothetical protein